jgi:DNA invertase Pin-like site-specific DNA recombinase
VAGVRTGAEFTDLVRRATWEAMDEVHREDRRHYSERMRERLQAAVARGIGDLSGCASWLRNADEEILRAFTRDVVRQAMAVERPS